MSEILKAENLCFSYEDRENVLTSISFEVAEGENTGVIGPNGAGKTTLFMIICGVYKATSGSVYVAGSKVEHRTFNPRVGYVFQSPDDQLFSPSVFDDVAFGPINMGLGHEEIEERVDETLKLCGCEHLSRRPSHHLSGGEKRMVAIASVLSMKPALMIYDEPTSNLDMRSRRKVIALIQRSGVTNLIASHDLEFIRELCQKVILMDSGRLIASGEPATILTDRKLMETSGLEVPYSLR